MLGLGDYASSDDDSQEEPDIGDKDEEKQQSKHTTISNSAPIKPVELTASDGNDGQPVARPLNKSLAATTIQGPMMPRENKSEDRSPADDVDYTDRSREHIRRLTMPPVPNLEIPPSPPGSPSARADQKFAHFLKLKEQGFHFNSKLESSQALRNPALLQKLMQFAQIDEYDQYASALPVDLAIPTSFPPWAYGDTLNQTQQRLLKRKQEENKSNPRDKVEFVSGARSSANSLER